MGLKLQRRVLKSALPRPLRFLATVLALYADEDGDNIYPSVSTLAADLGLHRTGVIRQLRDLREIGVLEVVRAGGGRHRVTRYRMAMERLPSRQENSSASATVTGDGRRSAGATVSVINGSAYATVWPRNSSASATPLPSTSTTNEELKPPRGHAALPEKQKMLRVRM